MRSAGRDELERVGRRLLVHTERVVEHADQVRACGDLIASSVLDLVRTAEPDEVRERAEAVRAGVVRAVLLLFDVSAESGAMLGLAHAAEVITDEHSLARRTRRARTTTERTSHDRLRSARAVRA